MQSDPKAAQNPIAVVGVNNTQGRQILWRVALLATGSDHVETVVEDFSVAMLSGAAHLGQRFKERSDEFPLMIFEIRGIAWWANLALLLAISDSLYSLHQFSNTLLVKGTVIFSCILSSKKALCYNIKPMGQPGKYCKAYLAKDFRKFPAWKENTSSLRKRRTQENGKDVEIIRTTIDDNDVLYLHDNWIVCDGIYKDENVVFDDVSDSWKEFCDDILKFRVPADLLDASQ